MKHTIKNNQTRFIMKTMRSKPVVHTVLPTHVQANEIEIYRMPQNGLQRKNELLRTIVV